jgi:hypothetical protein
MNPAISSSTMTAMIAGTQLDLSPCVALSLIDLP